jgi:hypothetical protein
VGQARRLPAHRHHRWFLLSAAEQTYLPPLRWLGVPLEIWVVIAVARRLRRPVSGGDAVTRIREAAGAVFRYDWAAELAATEIGVFYYALFAWRARPQSAPGCRAFGLAEASGYEAFLILLMMAVVVEGVPLHLLLRSWSQAGAWIFTGIGIPVSGINAFSAACRCVITPSRALFSHSSLSRSSWLIAIRSIPPALRLSRGTFYFAQIGISHIAATAHI